MMLDWLSANWMTCLLVVTSTVTAASVALHAIAPLTETKADDKAAAGADWLLALLKKLSLNKSGV